jgi:hypothetical protein
LYLIFSLSGAYYHENFVQQNREMSLEITRIKAPGRKSCVSKLHAKQPEENATESGSPAWSRFNLFPNQDASSTSGSNALTLTPRPHLSTYNNNVLLNGAGVCQGACSHNSSCSHQLPKMAGLSTSSNDSPAMPTQQKQVPRDTSVADTYDWLISAGFQFSAFDPDAIKTAQGPNAVEDSLIACADEIKSLFSLPSPPPSSPSSPKVA